MTGILPSQLIIGKLARYILIGGGSVVMYLGLYEVLRRFTGLGVTASVVGAYLPTLVATFLAQSRLTFGSRENSFKTVLKYLVAMGCALGVVVITVSLLNGVFGVSELISNLAACAVSPLVGFLLQNFWVFRNTQNHVA